MKAVCSIIAFICLFGVLGDSKKIHCKSSYSSIYFPHCKASTLNRRYYAVQNDISGYYLCSGDRLASYANCPAGYKFDDKKQKCIKICTKKPCTSQPCQPFENCTYCDITTLWAHPNDTNQFIQCLGVNCGVPMKCPKGLEFNQQKQVCDWPYVSTQTCPSKPTTPIPTTTECVTDNSSSTTTQIPDNSTTTLSTTISTTVSTTPSSTTLSTTPSSTTLSTTPSSTTLSTTPSSTTLSTTTSSSTTSPSTTTSSTTTSSSTSPSTTTLSSTTSSSTTSPSTTTSSSTTSSITPPTTTSSSTVSDTSSTSTTTQSTTASTTSSSTSTSTTSSSTSSTTTPQPV